MPVEYGLAALSDVYAHVVFVNSLQMHRNVGNDSQIWGSLPAAVTEDYWLHNNSLIRVFQRSFEMWEATASMPGLTGHCV